MLAHFENGENVTAAKFELAFTRCRHNLKTVGKLTVKSRSWTLMLQKSIYTLRIDQSRSKSVEKMICLRCCFKFIPVRVPFSKSTVFEICRQKMCRFRVNRRPIRHIFHCFQNLPASCERSLSHIELCCYGTRLVLPESCRYAAMTRSYFQRDIMCLSECLSA